MSKKHPSFIEYRLSRKVEMLEKKYDEQFEVLFEVIKKLLSPTAKKSAIPMGFRTRK